MKKALLIIGAVLLLSGLAFAGGEKEIKKPSESAKTETAKKVEPESKTPWFEKKTGDSDNMLPAVNPLKVTGNIITAGSSTVFPLSEKIVERFKDEGYSGTITIDSIGSGAGFERFCVAGESDISNASAPMPDTMKEKAKQIGREVIEFKIGVDALAVVVSKENTFLKNVTQAELAQIFSTAQKWSDVNPAWPKEDIRRFIPGTDSGTFSYFVEHIFKKKKEPILAAKNLQLSEDDNVLVQGVMGSPYAIGFFGFAYYQENRTKLNVLSIDGVEPNDATVLGGKYPLARPLFLYTSPKILQDKPQVAAFINFYLTNVNEEIKKVGYFPIDADTLKKSKQLWLDVMKGLY